MEPVENLPGNSDKKREPITPVVTGKVNKSNTSRRIWTEMFKEDAHTVGEGVLWEIVIPSIKNVILDTFSTAMDRLLFGGDTRPRRPGRVGERVFNGSQGTNYTSYSQRNVPSRPYQSTRDRQSPQDVSNITLETRADAEIVLDQLYDQLSKYGSATVGDVYSLIGATATNIDESWGWRFLDGARIVKSRGGYWLQLPEPIYLKR